MSEPVLVVDVGSSCVKAGFSGEDTPSSVFPATTGKWSAGVDAVEAHSSEALAGINLEFPANTPFPHPIHRGAVKDFEQLEKLWQTILSGAGVSTPEGTSCLLVEPLRSSAADRLKWAEIIFEGHHHAPSMCIGNGSSLALFAAGRTTGVVVECGAGLTSSVPVFEGLALSHAAISWEYGGQDISLSLRKLLAEHTGVQVDMADTRLVKEQLARVSVSGPAKSGKDALHVNLPDGTEVVVDKGIFSVCTEKLLVDPKSVHGGLISQVYESISLCDDTIRRDLAKNIILSGGTSMLNGLGDRLSQELEAKFGSDGGGLSVPGDVLVIPNSLKRERGYSSQRKHAAWIGGSIIGSLEAYRDLKITRQEYDEGAEHAIFAKSF